MDKSEFLEFSSRELAEINTVTNEIKENKLQSFFIELLSNNELDYIDKLLNKEVVFYEQLNAVSVLEKSIENISHSLFRNDCEQALENIKNIQDTKYQLIKAILIEKVVLNVLKIQEEDYTPEQLDASPFHKETIKLAQKLLLENPQYVNKFNDVKLKEFKILKKVVELDNKLPPKNIVEKKSKI